MAEYLANKIGFVISLLNSDCRLARSDVLLIRPTDNQDQLFLLLQFFSMKELGDLAT